MFTLRAILKRIAPSVTSVYMESTNKAPFVPAYNLDPGLSKWEIGGETA